MDTSNVTSFAAPPHLHLLTSPFQKTLGMTLQGLEPGQDVAALGMKDMGRSVYFSIQQLSDGQLPLHPRALSSLDLLVQFSTTLGMQKGCC